MEPHFIHLRLHTEYSLSDGLVRIKPLIELAAKNGMNAVAITDQSNLFGIVKFYQAAVNSGIKPIIGADIWLDNKKDAPFRLTLLCQNNIGYKNLIKIISQGYLQGQTQGKAIIQKEWLHTQTEGLIALSGAEEGDIGQALLSNHPADSEPCARYWQTLFPDRFYLELRRTGRAREENYIQGALTLAEKFNLPIVATNDVRFLKVEDFDAHEARTCIHEGRILADPNRPKRYTEKQYFRSAEEMKELFSDLPEALLNTVEIAKRCTVTLTLGKSFLPRCAVPDEYTTETYLVAAAKKGLDERLNVTLAFERHAYDLRLETELNVINKMGFAGYFLIVADFTQWARDNRVPVGPGRGSGPGSLVAYALKITDLDPLAHELLFERFLNPERVSMPDFDIDFCMEGRDRVIDYVMETHGRESVAQIITYGTMAAKAVIRDVGRVLGMGYGFVDKIAKLIPFELGITLEKALEQEPTLAERYQQEEDVRTLIDLARKLEGVTRNVGKHAGGVVIAPEKLTEFTPLYCEEGAPDHIVTQFDKDDVESVGLVKFDFLGLRTLTIIDWAVQHINALRLKNAEAPLDIHLLPMKDAATFTLLKECKTTAIFQLESRGMKDLVKRLQPDCFEEIVALVALFRPGPLQSGMVDDFINRKHGRAKVNFPHPKLAPILSPTYGVILYQEQVMQIAQVLAGYTLGAADMLRRAMGKKKPEEMAKQREVFCKGAVNNGVPAETASHIFDLMEKFAGYGFNKSHSASYALISYQTAWLKAHYTSAYMAAVLSSDMDNTDKTVHFIDECRALKLTIEPPDINLSQYQFKALDEKNLAYGLGAIKGAGEAAIESIITARQESPFIDLFDFCRRVDLRKVNKRVLEALIKAGAFDKIGPHRKSMMESISLALHQAEQTLRNETAGQQDLFATTAEPSFARLEYIKSVAYTDQERLFAEKETLGYYLSGHPIHRYLVELDHFTTRLAVARPGQSKSTTVAGIITQVRSLQTKRGDRMAVLTLDDASGQMDVLCFSDIYHKFRELLVKDKLIITEGEISFDEFNDAYRIIARDIYSVEEGRERFAKNLQIRLSEMDDKDMTKLASLLKDYRGGKCRVTINYLKSDAKANLQLGETWRVKPTDSLMNTLKNAYSETNVEIFY